MQPKISIVTPSYNQGSFIEETFDSIFSQNYKNLELIVIDGGSTDNTLSVIKKYEKYITSWVSEPDRGQVDAINKGLLRCTGSLIGWQNSDDVYIGDFFQTAADIFQQDQALDLIMGDLALIDYQSRVLRVNKFVKPTLNSLLAEGMVISNQSALWTRKAMNRVGLLEIKYDYSFDYDFFLKIVSNGSVRHSSNLLGGLRIHKDTKSSMFIEKFHEENEQIRSGYKLNNFFKIYYKIRRFLLLVKQGDCKYAYRGALNNLLSR